MTTPGYGEITRNGLWKNNPALVQLLGLCPLLAVTGSVVNAIGLGLATTGVITSSNLAVSLVRRQMPDTVRLPASVMIIATFVTCVELLMKAYTYELYLMLGIFIPLIVTNCAILGRAEAFASKNAALPSLVDGLMMGIGFTAVLIAVGAVREILGQGTLFSNMDLLLGPMAKDWRITVLGSHYPGALVAVLPPGAFLVTGLLIAAKNAIDTGIEKHRSQRIKIVPGSKRVRVTGRIV
ncbi:MULTISPECIES: electron transport complex subunit E [unclassified Microbulbifer]|uniref:Ion-translocating oxidoreductase complex subunit E n=1 Tax=Microbulbifer spongiae TaxID=2944933 RepID=A0ABY9EE60_9GAMM|nr:MULTISPECIES: electron transport complex subunit E [unclassified Microbulbifer]MDP5209782.1 electron transport complex subunit E [Microbulbifer sp. 2205BS26-8]WKD50437.1 electron transport complex subunit E [Microbulbifer sp. MI-G]